MKKPPRKVAVIGFGSQGKAQAIRLRKSGVQVMVGLRSRSRSRAIARRLGFSVAEPRLAVRDCDMVALLVPDRAAREVLGRLGPHLDLKCGVIFAAGYPLVFPKPLRADFDLLLVAPHGPGRDLETGRPMSGFVAVGHDATGKAMSRARWYARAIGLKPLFGTTPRTEALGDLFGEQALLCGGLVGLTSAVAGVMVRKGIPASHAWFETVSQLEQLSRLLAERGIRGFWDEISDCAAAGSALASPRLYGLQFARALEVVWGDIESGRFARTFQKHGRPKAYPAAWKILEQLEKARRTGRDSGTPAAGRRSRPTRRAANKPAHPTGKRKGGRLGHP